MRDVLSCLIRIRSLLGLFRKYSSTASQKTYVQIEGLLLDSTIQYSIVTTSISRVSGSMSIGSASAVLSPIFFFLSTENMLGRRPSNFPSLPSKQDSEWKELAGLEGTFIALRYVIPSQTKPQDSTYIDSTPCIESQRKKKENLRIGI